MGLMKGIGLILLQIQSGQYKPYEISFFECQLRDGKALPSRDRLELTRMQIIQEPPVLRRADASPPIKRKNVGSPSKNKK